MTDKPVTTYVVSVFEKPHWRTVLKRRPSGRGLGVVWGRPLGLNR